MEDEMDVAADDRPILELEMEVVAIEANPGAEINIAENDPNGIPMERNDMMMVQIGFNPEVQPEVIEVNDDSLQPEANVSNATASTTNDDSVAEDTSTKKRKRTTKKKQETLKRPYVDDEDDGSTCPICFDHWEISGGHKLVSLKCGHLFGHSCISRWLKESARSTRCCPSCKARATTSEVRQIFARKVISVDKEEEYRLRELIEKDKTTLRNLQLEFSKKNLELAVQMSRSRQLEEELEKLKKQIVSRVENSAAQNQRAFYKMFLDKNVEISKDDGCRVMQYCATKRVLYCSQKLKQNLFPGHGVRFIDIPTMKLTNFLFVSQKVIRDMKLNQSDGIMITASIDRTAMLLDVNCNTPINSIIPGGDSIVWSCGFDKMDHNRILLGNQSGTIFSFDIRRVSEMEASCSSGGDTSPVLQICPVDTMGGVLPYGGFLVCKLQSFWLFEYKGVGFDVETHRLNVIGPFSSLAYNKSNNTILLSTRPTQKVPVGRLIVGQLKRISGMLYFDEQHMFYGSKLLAKLTNNAIVNVGSSDSIVATYLQDTHRLVTWNLKSGVKMQSLPIDDTVFDLQPIYLGDSVYLSALTGSKCRLYNIVQSYYSE